MFRRNTYLWSVIVIGAIVTMIGGTGIFAVFTDQATAGPNQIVSGDRPTAADLQIAEADGGAQTCSNWQQNLEYPVWSASNIQPGDEFQRVLCLKSNGSASISVFVGVTDLHDLEAGCSAGEQDVDTDCQSGGPGYGELEDVLRVKFDLQDCETGELIGPVTTTSLPQMTSPTGLAEVTIDGGLAAGATECLSINVFYPSTTSLEATYAAQSDVVSWKFVFHAQAQG